MANQELGTIAGVTATTGKIIPAYLVVFGTLFGLAEIQPMADLAAVFAVSVMVGTIFFTKGVG